MPESSLLPEQEDLLCRLLDAHERLLPEREPFHYIRDMSVAANIVILMHRGWTRDSADVYLDDLDALDDEGYIRRGYLKNGGEFGLTAKAFSLRESLEPPAAEEAEEETSSESEPSGILDGSGKTKHQGLVPVSLSGEYPRGYNIFRKHGDMWLVIHEGICAWVRHSLGMSYIAQLLSAPGKRIHAAALRALVLGGGDTFVFGPAGEMVDQLTLDDIDDLIARINALVQTALGDGDQEQAASLIDERDRLEDERKRVTGLYGKPREATSQREQARQAVCVAIRRARMAIKKQHKPLWKHLRTYLDTGNFLCYRGDQSIRWTTM